MTISVLAHKQKPRKNTSEGISGGKPIKILEEIEKAIEAQRAGSSREVNLLH